MKLQILKLIIWPKNESYPPRSVDFVPGKVNVITGSSRTGKSAIIPIIDYCLASSDCFIPIDTIRDFTSWYGLIFQTETEHILVGRMAPKGSQVSNEFYLQRGTTSISVPPKIESPNETIDGVKQLLNSISYVPYFALNGERERQSFQAHLGFRDLMALVFQNQDIVANQNILFYKTHSHDHRERLRNWFPYILGAETIEILRSRQRIQEIEKRLTQLKREFEKARAHSLNWMSNMAGHLRIAKEYGLITEDPVNIANSDGLLQAAKEVLRNIPEHSKTEQLNIQSAGKEVDALEKEEERISLAIGQAKRRLNDLRRLKSGFVDYGNSVRKRVERLQISQWLQDVAMESQSCPACGSETHPNSNAELSKITTAFKKIEGESKTVTEIPTSFSREESRIISELEKLLEEKRAYQKRYDLVLARDKRVQEEFQRRKNMYLFLGHLRASTETFESLGDGGEFKKEISELEKELIHLRGITDSEGVRRRIDAATARISQNIHAHLQTLDVDEKYRSVAPRFDIKNLTLSILSSDNNWHFLAEVGSASNWVSFHIALICAMQEYFLELQFSCVPSFAIFDQPSQVYFPKVKRGDESKDVDPKYIDEDVEAVKSIFRTAANSVLKTDGAWQCIILDHADRSIYENISGVVEIEEWRNHKKLIPEEWYKIEEPPQ